MYNNIYISWWVYFVKGLNLVLQQALTAILAKTKADIAKKRSYCYSSRCMEIWKPHKCTIASYFKLRIRQKILQMQLSSICQKIEFDGLLLPTVKDAIASDAWIKVSTYIFEFILLNILNIWIHKKFPFSILKARK